jgi:Arc/MetJ family transcription regulator
MPYDGRMATDEGQAPVTGDDLITQLVEATDLREARAIMDAALPDAVFAAADLTYVDCDGHGMRWIRNAVLSEARA